MSSRLLSRIETGSELYNCFRVNLLDVQNFILILFIYRHFKNAKQQSSFCQQGHISTLFTIYHRMYNAVLAYHLLEDKRAIDVIIAKFFPSCFKMEENFENLNHILRDWAKDTIQKSLVEALNRYEKQKEERNSRTISVGQSSEAKPTTILVLKLL